MIETAYNISGCPIKLALLGDLHGRSYVKVIDSLRIHKPQLIAVAGDIIYGKLPKDDISPLESQHNVIPFLRSCAEISPTYLSLGNHEWLLDKDDLDRICDTGVILLDNEWKALHLRGNKILIGGLTSAYVTDYRRFRNSLSLYSSDVQDSCKRYIGKGIAGEDEKLNNKQRLIPELAWLREYTAFEGYKILLNHHPEYYYLIPKDINLILSAHCHGGQIRLYDPIHRNWHGVWAPGQGLFPKYSEGVHEDRFVISRGLSNTAKVPRILNPTEIVYINCF